MPSRLELSAVALSRWVGVFLLCLLFVTEVCTALGWAVDPNGAGASGSTSTAPASQTETTSALDAFAMAECGDDPRDQSMSETGKRAHVDATGSNEQHEENGETLPPSDGAWLDSARGTCPRRPDPIIEPCRGVAAQTRAPPAFARTVV